MLSFWYSKPIYSDMKDQERKELMEVLARIMSRTVKPIAQPVTASAEMAVDTISNTVATTITQPICNLAESAMCSTSDNSTALSSALSLIPSGISSTVSNFVSQPMCALAESAMCEAPSNTTLISSAVRFLAPAIPTFPVLTTAGTACEAVGQCAVSSTSSVFAPALALSAATLAGIGLAFAFRPSNDKRKRPSPVTPVAPVALLNLNNNGGINFGGGFDDGDEPEEQPQRRNVRRRLNLDGAASPASPQQPPIARRSRLRNEVAALRASIGSVDNDQAHGSGHDLPTPNHPGGGVRRSYRNRASMPANGARRA